MEFSAIYYVLAGLIVVMTANAGPVKHNNNPHHSQHSPTVHHKLLNESQHPNVEANLVDFKGDVVKNLTRHQGSYVVLPHLDVEDYIWEGYSIQLKCSYSQPIQWSYHGDGAPLVKISTHRLAPIFENKSTFQFGATVIFTHTQYKQTGRYRCESIPHPKQHADLHVFVPGRKLFVRAEDKEKNNQQHEAMHLTLYSSPSYTWFRIPCSVSRPNVSVQLLKDGKDIQEYTNNVHFDPEHGFEIDSKHLNNIWGKYKCVDQGTKESISFDAGPSKYVLVGSEVGNNQQDSNKILSYNENPFELRQYPHIKFHYDPKKRLLTCCAFDFQGDRLNQQPTMKYAPCESVNECRFARKRLEVTQCDSSSGAICQGKPMKRNCRGNYLPEGDEAGVVECSLGDISQEYFQFSKIGDVVISDFNTIPNGSPALEVIEEPSSSPGTRKFTCLANHFFFSEGIKWATENHSKQLSFLEDEFPPKISVDINPDEARKIHCFAPVWNSYEWKNASLAIT